MPSRELNTERRQLIGTRSRKRTTLKSRLFLLESSTQKRTRRRVAPVIQVEQQEKKVIPLEPSSQPRTNHRRE